jgi:hypothetical protein
MPMWSSTRPVPVPDWGLNPRGTAATRRWRRPGNASARPRRGLVQHRAQGARRRGAACRGLWPDGADRRRPRRKRPQRHGVHPGAGVLPRRRASSSPARRAFAAGNARATRRRGSWQRWIGSSRQDARARARSPSSPMGGGDAPALRAAGASDRRKPRARDLRGVAGSARCAETGSARLARDRGRRRARPLRAVTPPPRATGRHRRPWAADPCPSALGPPGGALAVALAGAAGAAAARLGRVFRRLDQGAAILVRIGRSPRRSCGCGHRRRPHRGPRRPGLMDPFWPPSFWRVSAPVLLSRSCWS